MIGNAKQQPQPINPPRPLVINKTPCRTGVLLAFIVLATAVITVDRYITNDVVRRAEDIEAWDIREVARIKAVDNAQMRLSIAVRTQEVMAQQIALLQQRLDGVSISNLKLMQENTRLRHK